MLAPKTISSASAQRKSAMASRAWYRTRSVSALVGKAQWALAFR